MGGGVRQTIPLQLGGWQTLVTHLGLVVCPNFENWCSLTPIIQPFSDPKQHVSRTTAGSAMTMKADDD